MDTISIKRKNIIIKKIVNKTDIIIPESIIHQVIIPQITNAKNTSKTVILKCPHQKNKRYCKICNPSCYCIHNKIKKNCIVCKPLNYCIHNRRKSACKDCKTGICLHGRYSTKCKDCKTGICVHNMFKSNCKECGKEYYCIHNRIKKRCKDCKTGLCKHKSNKYECIKCNTKLICPHGKNKRYCKDCCTSSKFCLHKKEKQKCKECGGSALCKSSWCDKKKQKKYNNYCMVCCIQLCPDIKISRNYKTKENTVVTSIKEAFPNFTWVCDKKVEDGCSRRRPDLLLDMGSHIIIVEVDENKHTDYDCSCENKRLMEISKDVGHRSIVFIRFNPDGYKDKDGKTIKSCWICTKQGAMVIVKTKQAEWDERIKSLKTQIQYWIDNKTEKTVEIVELFY
jgi:hypothetical protein